MPPDPGRPYGWPCRQADRYPGCHCPDRGLCDHLLRRDPAFVPRDLRPDRRHGFQMAYDLDPAGHLPRIHGFRASRHAERQLPRQDLHVCILCPACICFYLRQPGQIYCGNRLFRPRKSCPEFCGAQHLDRCAAHLVIPAELDDLLLGVLAGMVRRITVFHGQHFQRPHRKAGRARSFCLRYGLNLHFLYHSRKLCPRPANA